MIATSQPTSSRVLVQSAVPPHLVASQPCFVEGARIYWQGFRGYVTLRWENIPCVVFDSAGDNPVAYVLWKLHRLEPVVADMLPGPLSGELPALER